nr:MAG: hypothetical protein [Molluscum contagiosum virus]
MCAQMARSETSWMASSLRSRTVLEKYVYMMPWWIKKTELETASKSTTAASALSLAMSCRRRASSR